MEKDQGFEYKDGASIEQKKEPTEYERGYRQAMDDTWKWFAKGFPRDISRYIEDAYKNVMERNLKDKLIMTTEEKGKAYDIVREKIALRFGSNIAEEIFSEFEEPEDEKIRKAIHIYLDWLDGRKDYAPKGEYSIRDMIAWIKRQGEIDKISYEIAEKEKREFVGGGFIKCYADFQDFKEGKTYWLEYLGNDDYNVRSDNLLGKTYHITPCQLYTIFKKQTWREKQGEKKSKKVYIWKHWKNGIAGNGDGEPIYLTKVGYTYNLTSCLGFECDYIELSELDNLMLEKQDEQKLCMIQWKGDNLKEVINFTGKDKNFDKWFKSFEEYEKYVHEHNDIFKLFNEDGSHYEVPVGAWIVKTPDGYNVASKAVLKQKPDESPKDYHSIDPHFGISVEDLMKKKNTDDNKVEPKFKVKYAGNEYNVLETKDITGVTFYGIEDEPNHIDYVKAENCEMISGLYAIKENGSPYPTNPAEWSEEDETILNQVITNYESGYLPSVVERDEIVKKLKSLKDRVQPQLKQEWSKEDEETFGYLEDIVNFCYCNQYVVNVQTCERVRQLVFRLKSLYFQPIWGKDDITRIDEIIETLNIVQANRVRTQRMHYNKAAIDRNINWLRTLKDRVQPKVELTQLDKNILEAAIAFVEQNNHLNCWGGVDKHTVLSALRSIRYQNRWKPSDEQIQALVYVFNHYIPNATDKIAWNALQTIELMLGQLLREE